MSKLERALVCGFALAVWPLWGLWVWLYLTDRGDFFYFTLTDTLRLPHTPNSERKK